MKLILARHGETTGDVENRYGGAYDDGLSDEGLMQAAELAEALAGKGIEVVYCSDLLRAQETADTLAKKLGCDVKIVPGLRERDQYGELTGMEKREAAKQFPALVALVKDRLNTLPGAESYEEAATRMIDAFEQVVAEAHDCAAVVWHGGGMRVLFREILEMGELTAIGDCCWVELEKVGEQWVVEDSQGLGFGF